MDTIFLVAKIMKVLKAEGAVALESHVEAPESSPIFGEYPRLLKDHALTHLITDSIRLIVVSSSAPRPDAVEDIMNAAIKTHHHDALKSAETFIKTFTEKERQIIENVHSGHPNPFRV